MTSADGRSTSRRALGDSGERVAVAHSLTIRLELEATRAAYHALLTSLSADEWYRKSANPDLTVKELMWHLAWSVGWLAGFVDAVRAGKNSRLPGFLVEPVRLVAMRWLARKATPEKAAQHYDEGHAALLAKLDTIAPDDWQRSTTRFGQTRTVEWCFRQPALHFAEHAADVRPVTNAP